jgi:phosphate:Na+ symporter
MIGVIVMYPFVGTMTRFLEKHIKQKKPEVEKPVFLTKAALAYPQTAISALVNETKHLFDNVFKIMAHGLGYHRGEVLEKKPAASTLKPISASEIDKSYYRKVKYIYGKIIEFASHAQEQHQGLENIQAIYNIKEANRYFVDAVKDVKDLQPNMLKYTTSENKAMKREYNLLRNKIAKIIRQVFKARQFDPPEDISIDEINKLALTQIEVRQKKLKRHLLRIRNDDVLFNGTLDRLIRNKEITSEMASSLINDSALTASIAKHLIKAAELLYLNTDILLTDIIIEAEAED